MTTNNNGTLFLRVGAGALVVAALSILVANILNDLSEVVWLMLIPIGALGGITVGACSLGLYAARRRI